MLADIIPKIAADYFKESEPDKSFSPRPSLAGPQRCIRQMVYHGLNIPRSPLPGRAVLIFDDSSWHEELTAEWIRKSSYKLHSEQMLVDCRPPMRKGRIDGIITDMLNIDRLLEHKAINHFTFQRYWDNPELPLDYFAQCAIYIEGLQRINPDITEGLLLIKNKNTAQYMEYEFGYTSSTDTLHIFRKTRSSGEIVKLDMSIPDIIMTACDKFNKILDYIKHKTLPKRQYDINEDWQCLYCGWCKQCWGEYEKEFIELRTDAMLPNEIADMIRYYRELGAQKKEIESEYDTLRKNVKDTMKEINVREGIAGEYVCRLKLIKTSRIDKTLLSEAELQKALVNGFQERLFISQRKEINNV